MDWSPYPVRILGPTLWSVTAIGTIYFTCAAYDVYQDAKKYSKGDRRTLTFEQIEADAAPKRFRDKFLSTPSDARTGPIVVSSPLDLWNGLSGPGKVMASVIGINTLTLGLRYVPSKLTRRFVYSLAHTPVQGNFRYRQLLTSAFAHTGPIHMGMNMLVMFNFASSLARTPEFEGSGSHTLAFYLSGGIVSSLGNHIATRFWPNKMARLMPALGFSGVVSAIFAAWCMEHPDGRVRLLFIPWDFTARGMLEGVTAFEVVGVLGLLRYTPIHVAHAAHLSGLLFGAAYVTYGQGGKYWNSFRSAAFRGLKTVGAI
ncbi:unnamed protein product [Discula destructiva]